MEGSEIIKEVVKNKNILFEKIEKFADVKKKNKIIDIMEQVSNEFKSNIYSPEEIDFFKNNIMKNDFIKTNYIKHSCGFFVHKKNCKECPAEIY